MAQLEQLLKVTYASPVLGDTFPRYDPDRLVRVQTQLGAIAAIAMPEFTGYIQQGMPELDEAGRRRTLDEILTKTLAFCPALTEGNIDDVERLSAVCVAVALMYWGDQGIDRGDQATEVACKLLGNKRARQLAEQSSAPVLARFSALRNIEDKVADFAAPEDAPLVLDRFYIDVLHNEVRMQELSREYLAAGSNAKFLAAHAAELAQISTADAGFPSISASLYAVLRQQDPSLPPLTQIDADPVVQQLLQVCNVTARLWDDIGDWQMDSGSNPKKGVFVINPFNQYHPLLVQHFCELATIASPLQTKLQQAFSRFHAGSETARQQHSAYIIEALRLHIRNYIRSLPAAVSDRFGPYIDLCKRVLEISYVNRIGDIALTAS